jgi:D-glycero-alpha-D-manno-heptose-7-phosphate kinase
MSNNDSIALYDSYVPEYCDSGKICGAGGGGYFLFLKKNYSNLDGKDYLNLNIDRKGTSIIYNNYI